MTSLWVVLAGADQQIILDNTTEKKWAERDSVQWTPGHHMGSEAEMEKRADGANASVLIFSSCCANFLAVSAKNS